MTLWTRLSTTVAVAIAAAACGHHEGAAPSRRVSAAGSAAAPLASIATAVATEAPARIAPCSLLSAAEVGAILHKSVVSQSNGEGCEYGLDPSLHERSAAGGQRRAKTGSLPDLMSSFGKGGDFAQTSAAIANQSQVTLTFVRDDKSEDAMRSIYARTGETVRGALQPAQPEARLGTVIRPGDDIPGVGDWAFATNVASVQMGPGFSSRGRILETRAGPWHVTVIAVVSPDPGADALDRELAGIARAAFAKLPS